MCIPELRGFIIVPWSCDVTIAYFSIILRKWFLTHNIKYVNTVEGLTAAVPLPWCNYEWNDLRLLINLIVECRTRDSWRLRRWLSEQRASDFESVIENFLRLRRINSSASETFKFAQYVPKTILIFYICLVFQILFIYNKLKLGNNLTITFVSRFYSKTLYMNSLYNKFQQ